jgi:hypothetical protein
MTTFTLSMKAFAEKFGQNADAAIRTICLDLLKDIVLNTPVDSGRARANWQCSINTPVSGRISFSADSGSGITAPKESAASADAILRGTAISAQASGNVFWISNNLPYIYRLEFEGWSKQAPNGMVRLAIDRAKRRMR